MNFFFVQTINCYVCKIITVFGCSFCLICLSYANFVEQFMTMAVKDQSISSDSMKAFSILLFKIVPFPWH